MKTLSQTISLRVKRSTHCNSTLQLFHKTLPKFWLKSSITVTNYFLRHTKSTNPMFKQQLSSLIRIYSTFARNKSNHSTKTINYSKNTIITTLTNRQIKNKIHTNMFKWLRRVLKRLQQANRLLSTTFVLLANTTIFTKLLNTLEHLFPIKPFSN